ncbi:helix-turn-helix domain-containing protein [Uliginosibacterium gangwonense]|uniref:helix-turn-helix domain-containing protein n=1 Tax=Uliginosibacterium gangwonense TaxID=392736 RepID=UPI00037A36F1|nr:helix-turn-helix domain-containing protein [Uliginosibacterium gangwonense]
MNPHPDYGISHANIPDALRLRSVNAHDVDEHADNLSAWEQHYDQLSAGRFSGTLTEFWTPNTQVFFEHTSQAVRQSCKVWKEALWFGIPVHHDGTRVDGREAPDGAILVRPGDADFELVTPDEHRIFGLVVRHEALDNFCQAQGITPDWSNLEHARWIALNTDLRKAAVGLLQHLFSELAQHSVPNPHHAACRDLEHTVMELLLPFVGAAGSCQDVGHDTCASLARRRQVVGQILEYAHQHPDWVPSVPELCERYHLSRRSLQYAFEDVLGTSPAVYLRAMRLNGVRRFLRTGRCTSVQDAATAWGFWNLSQFSVDYRRFFGERPSDTLHQFETLAPAPRYPARRH